MGAVQELTDIQRFYKNSTVFLTGATGFIGKLVLEKILRALPVKKVFILVRKKRDVLSEKRVQNIFESPAFSLLKRNNPEALEKVCLVEGDCSLPMLGMSEEDQNTFIEEVNVVFHVAATVRFDEVLKKSVLTNVRATRDLIILAQKIKKLKTFVYMGTGFSNCNQPEIQEKIYPARIAAEKLIAVCENLDDECLNSMTPTLVKGWPNNYTFSKQVTEDYINRNAKNIPISIVRPTIVVSTMSEPVASFVDNLFTLAGFVMGTAVGLTRISYYKNTNLDIVPADFVVNQFLAVGWQTGETFMPFKREVPVYHVSSSMDNPITQDQTYDGCDYYFRQIVSDKVLLYPLFFRTTCKYNYLFWRIFFHTLAGYILDLVLKIKGKEPQFTKAMKKLHKFQESYEFFTTRNFYFHMENTHKLIRKMSFKDRELFNFDVTTINWETYFMQYTRGMRIYLLDDPLETVPYSFGYYYLRRVFISSLITFTIVLYVVGKLFLFRVVPVVFGLVLYVIRNIVC